MKQIINLVGARPQFIKAAMLSKVLRNNYGNIVRETLVHSGQHYDFNLSGVFFKQLGLPNPDVFLEASKGNISEQSDKIKNGLQNVLREKNADLLIVYGDTTTTRAGAEAAAELNIPIAHVEAGLRSHNFDMPEEHNRIAADKLSHILFTPNEAAIANLKAEGIESGPNKIVENVGDVMIDSLRTFQDMASFSADVKEKLADEKPMILVTIHRNYNADHPEKLEELLRALEAQCEQYQVVFPVHPRTAKAIETEKSKITFLPPVSYFDMLALEQRASIILTDSGGVQKEAYFFKKPLVILRSETEWTALIENGLAKLSNLDAESIEANISHFREFKYPEIANLFGDGFAAEKMCKTMMRFLR